MPYTIEILNDPIAAALSANENLKELCFVSRTDNISSEIRHLFPSNWQPSPCLLTPKWTKIGDAIQNFKVYEDDVWILSQPKCGTTWTEEMVWMICNDLDFEKGNINIVQRVPFLELQSVADLFDTLSIALNMNRPRFIMSHLPISLLPDELWTKTPKIVYISRNPKDAIVSFYHHYNLIFNYKGTLDEFVEAYLADRTFFAPYYEHIIDFYALKSLPNILYLTFEEMKKDLRSEIVKTAKFLNRSLNDEQIDLLVNHLSFDSMKNNKSVNHETNLIAKAEKEGRQPEDIPKFIRKGQVGGWRSELSKESADKIDEKTKIKVTNKELLHLFESP